MKAAMGKKWDWKAFLEDAHGATLIEYGVVLFFVCAACISIITILGTDIVKPLFTIPGGL